MRSAGEGAVLSLTPDVLQAIVAHARRDAPLEACGYLAEKDGSVSRAFPLSNVDRSTDHFTLDPREQFAALRAMRAGGYTLRAVYHSHPATPARPSPEDIRLAFDPRLSYVIVSLASGEPDVKAFTIENGVATSEPVLTAQPASAGATP